MSPHTEDLQKELAALREQLAVRSRSEGQTLLLTKLVFNISIALAKAGSLEAMLQVCCETVVEQLGCAFARVWTLRPGSDILELTASAGLYTHLDGAHSRIPVGAFKIGRIARSREPHLTNAVQQDSQISDPGWAMREGMVAFAGHPLLIGNKLLGVLAVFSRSSFDESTLQVLATIASLVAHGIDREWLREEIEAALNASERSNDALQRFASVASHDLQEPLRQVTVFSQKLARVIEGELDEDGRRCLAFVMDGAARMGRLIDGLLAYAKIEAADCAPPQQIADCGLALAEALKNLQLAIEEAQAVVTCDTRLPQVSGNPIQLAQLFQNLVGNAVKYRSGRNPRVHVGAMRGDGEWRFSVSDNGVGIAPEHRSQIFGVFTRLNSREVSGSGLGLAICAKIVELHHGRIWVEANPADATGSVFYFTLPIVTA